MIGHKNIESRRHVMTRGRNRAIVARHATPRKNPRCDRIMRLSRECDQVYELVKGWWPDIAFPKDEGSILALTRQLAKVQTAVTAYKNALTDEMVKIIEKA